MSRSVTSLEISLLAPDENKFSPVGSLEIIRNVAGNNSLMDTITFPKNEWGSIKDRLETGKIVYSIRVDNEYGKYNLGDNLKTEWGLEVKILSVKKVTGGITGLKNEYEFYYELTQDMIQELNGYDQMEIIALMAASRS